MDNNFRKALKEMTSDELIKFWDGFFRFADRKGMFARKTAYSKKRSDSLKVLTTNKNKGLEPKMAVRRFIIGYDPEIHGEDSYEFTFTLPVGAIKRLIRSYFKDMESVDQEWAFINQSGSQGMAIHAYASRMLEDLKKQLDKHKLPGKKIVDEVFNTYFKESYDKMDRHLKNHPNQGIDDFKRCKDSECCKPLTMRRKVVELIGYLWPERWVLRFRWYVKNHII